MYKPRHGIHTFAWGEDGIRETNRNTDVANPTVLARGDRSVSVLDLCLACRLVGGSR